MSGLKYVLFLSLATLAWSRTPCDQKLVGCEPDPICGDPNIQSCLDAHPGGHVILPAGEFNPSLPLIMRGQGQWLSGDNDAEWNGHTVIYQQIQAPPDVQGGRISNLEVKD